MAAPRRIVAVVGATATGKTDVAEALARHLDGEVVCADSRQVFAELEIGTGKPAPAERAALPHHLFAWLTLGARPNAGDWARAAALACGAIDAAGRTPVVVGGSGLWIEAAAIGLVATPPPDLARRRQLQHEAEAEMPEAFHARLAAVDPATAARLAPADRQRIVRALEVWETTGRPLSWWHAQPVAPAVAGAWHVFELTVAPATLAARIQRRTRAMFDAGLADEARALLAAGKGPALRALRAVGYDEAIALAEGRATRAEAETRTSLRTRQLAKRQRTWFRHRVDAVRVPADEADAESIAARILAHLAGVGRGARSAARPS